MTKEYGVFYGSELYNYSATKEPIIEHMLYKRDVICISSEAGVGKSILAMQLMFNLTMGKPFLDTYSVPKKNRVLYLQTEGDRSETIERIGNMKKGLEIDDDMWVHVNLEGCTMNEDYSMEEFIDMIKEPNMDFDVIVIDPLYTTVKGSMIKDDVATAWVRNIRRLKSCFDAAVIVLHHDNKDVYDGGKVINKGNKNLFGSVFWGAFFNHNFKLKVKNGVHYLQIGKNRSGKAVDVIEMKLIEPEPLLFANSDDCLDLSTTKIVSLLRSGIMKSAGDIKGGIGMSKATTYRALGRLVASERVSKVNVGNKVFYKAREVVSG